MLVGFQLAFTSGLSTPLPLDIMEFIDILIRVLWACVAQWEEVPAVTCTR